MNTDDKKKFIIEKLIGELDLPQGAYEKAIKRYEDLGDWLSRDDSSLKDYEPHIFAQGSFRLGTATKPLTGEDEYDLDLACKLKDGIEKRTHSQKDLKEMVGKELELYRGARGIKEKVKEKHRCWRLEYQDDLSFHMDIVPCFPESGKRRQDIFESLTKSGADEAIAKSVSELTVVITDDRNHNYRSISDDWNISNPEGYANWFERTMKKALRFDLMEKSAQVDDVPLFRRKTPLQRVIQLLKKHRDIMFAEDEDSKPISIILTTLAAKAYSGEQDMHLALTNILENMGRLVNSITPRVPNPVDPGEDFADRWSMPKYSHLKLEDNFWSWLEQAKNDLSLIENSIQPGFISKQASAKFGIRLDEEVLAKGLGVVSSPSITSTPKRHEVNDENKPWRSEK